ncbi:MAG TPA: TatD family hydrolase [Tepidisphaeraceae bacterium]|jgi:TatD DNase family protein
MIDSHCHLTDPRLFDQIDAVLARAKAAGVTAMVTIGTDIADDHLALEVAGRYHDVVRCAIGVHPNHCQNTDLQDIDALSMLATDDLVVAIGETGLDYHYTRADRATQRKFFEAQLALAERLEKPVVIHSREAVDDTLAVLRAFPAVRCVFHCFTGTAPEAEAIMDAGHHIGFTGPITYKKNDELRRIVEAVPLDRLLIETDAPYLSPEPVRGTRVCEPAFVAHTLGVVAQVKRQSVAEMNRITRENTQQFYGMTIG